MAINTLATATLFQETLDKVAMHEALTGWMEANAGDVSIMVVLKLKFLKCLYKD